MRAPSDIPNDPVLGAQASNVSPRLESAQRHPNGDPYAARDIIEAHLPAVFRITMKLSGRREDAEDLAQDVFMKVFENIHKLRSDEQLAGWICTIARHHVCKEIRKRQRQRQVIACQNGQGELSAPTPNHAGPEFIYLAKEEQDEITRALGSLDSMYREILVLSDIEGMSYAEIAAMLGVPIGTIKSRLFRARKALSDMLAKPSSEFSQSGGCR